MPSGELHAHLDFPPLPSGRTVIRDGHAKLALAVFNDALDLAFKKPRRGQTLPRKLVEEIDNAHAWLLDTWATGPFSLSGVCETLRVYGGIEWDPEAIANAVEAGTVEMFTIRQGGRNGDSHMKVSAHRYPTGRRHGECGTLGR